MKPPFAMSTTHEGRLIVSVEDFIAEIPYGTAFAPFVCGGSAFTGRTPDTSHTWNYGGGFVLKRGTNSTTALWIGENAFAMGYGALESITWTVFSSSSSN